MKQFLFNVFFVSTIVVKHFFVQVMIIYFHCCNQIDDHPTIETNLLLLFVMEIV